MKTKNILIAATSFVALITLLFTCPLVWVKYQSHFHFTNDQMFTPFIAIFVLAIALLAITIYFTTKSDD